MIRISQIKSRSFLSRDELITKVQKILGPYMIRDLSILRESIDARKKGDLWILYSVAVSCDQEEKVLKKHLKNVDPYCPAEFVIPENSRKIPGSDANKKVLSPVVIGAGPAGLFAAYYLAKCGLCPILLERGKDVEERTKDVEGFWETGILDPDSNVQFGEGGAGAFSDGKLNTGVKDPYGRNRFVLQTFVEHGAPEKILYDAKPHIGTDLLRIVIRNMRNEIRNMGGQVRFQSKVTGFDISGGHLKSVKLENGEEIAASRAILAIGHSARDTFRMLEKMRLSLEAKPFAVGFRIQHPQKLIDDCMYGSDPAIALPPSPYKLTARAADGRGVYSFCMCPGGYVVNASSEAGRLAVNGMSYSARDGLNANSAIVMAVSTEDFGVDTPLAGLSFQERIEENAYGAGEGKIPYCNLGDFPGSNKLPGADMDPYFSDFLPQCKGNIRQCDLGNILPDTLNSAFLDGMEHFAHVICGFGNKGAVLCATESRTSSPVRILRREDTLESVDINGLYPCGEGAGYAGGIVSAAIDGLKVAQAVAMSLGIC